MSYAINAASVAVDTSFAGVWAKAIDALWVVNHPNRRNDYQSGPHHWHTELCRAFKLHPLIQSLVNMGYRPIDWQRMLLEWPHVSVEDETQIAYTRNEAAGLDFLVNGSARQTRTPIGKYLSRHYAHVPDHVRRDWMLLFTPAVYEIWDTKEMIISGIELGPQSCMKSSNGSIPFNNRDNILLTNWYAGETHINVPWDKHPYAVYAPELGWRMAVRLDKGKPDMVMGRALINDKQWVRSYKRNESNPDSGYSHTDEKLEAWLSSQGYSKEASWEGYMVLHLLHPSGGTMMPYIDGDVQTASLASNGKHIRIETAGEFECNNTDATVDDNRTSVGDCDQCGDTVYEDDDRIWVGRDEDTPVCGDCTHHYTYVRGSGNRWSAYREYYVANRNAVEVNGRDYDEDHLPDNLVYCDNEDKYREKDECIKIDGDWYHEDSDDIVQCADDEYRLRADCWKSAKGKWYSEDETCVSVEAGDYHPDELQELIDNA